MIEYIDKKALQKAIRKALREIKTQEIVKCEECRYFSNGEWCRAWVNNTTPGEWCSRAEKKEDWYTEDEKVFF